MGRSIERVKKLTEKGRPIIVRIEDKKNGFSHWIVVDGINKRNGKNVVAIRDSAGGKQYFSPIDSFKNNFTGEVLIPNPQ